MIENSPQNDMAIGFISASKVGEGMALYQIRLIKLSFGRDGEEGGDSCPESDNWVLLTGFGITCFLRALLVNYRYLLS